MPAIICRLTPQGLHRLDCQADSLADALAYEPQDGVYTVGSTFHSTKTLLFDAHLDRLENSARSEGIPLRYDRQQLKSALRDMIIASNFGDVRFRISVPRAQPDSLLLTIEPYIPPSPSLLTHGARCITSSAKKRNNPAAKTSDWMRDRLELQKAMPADIYETILVDPNGFLLEGLSSNFYAILKDQLLTAKDGLLAGIARHIVLEICPQILPLCMRAPHTDAIGQFQEAFLTSSSRGILPIVELDGQPIGDGRVGPMTKRLRQAYQQWVQRHLEEL